MQSSQLDWFPVKMDEEVLCRIAEQIYHKSMLEHCSVHGFTHVTVHQFMTVLYIHQK